MFDKELCLEVLRQFEVATARIMTRFEPVEQVSDFTDTPPRTARLRWRSFFIMTSGLLSNSWEIPNSSAGREPRDKTGAEFL